MFANLYWYLFKKKKKTHKLSSVPENGQSDTKANVPNPAGASGMDPRSCAKAIMVATGSTRTAVSILCRKTKALIVTAIRARLINPKVREHPRGSEAGNKGDLRGRRMSYTFPKRL